jgi:peptidoglycan/xylan/chitin deacetylase (PgdA/CDA1 family)
MKTLKLLGFVPITFDQLLKYQEGGTDLPRKPVIITFDDVLSDAVDNAVPILESSGFKAVFYVPTNFVGIKSSWMLPEVNVEFQLIDWATVRSLDSRSFEIGSHTMNHPWLNRVSHSECQCELEGSRKKLEDFLGHEIRHLAYPFGAYDESVKKIACLTGYRTGCTTDPYIARIGNDLFSLPRLNMGMADSLPDFIIKLETAKTPIRKLETYLWVLRGKIPKPIRQFIKKCLPNKNQN